MRMNFFSNSQFQEASKQAQANVVDQTKKEIANVLRQGGEMAKEGLKTAASETGKATSNWATEINNANPALKPLGNIVNAGGQGVQIGLQTGGTGVDTGANTFADMLEGKSQQKPAEEQQAEPQAESQAEPQAESQAEPQAESQAEPQA
ncbi:uncharacterized protein [Venturia canescens]|uniref:uncharacterized protein n=1 Tax=Venturia canescens TaxID=32260 RepID=UPI001C9C85B2|nr:uncharacterized protein LOC122410766 [Venturia canescens]